jgi:hypothetical protein
MNFMSRAAESSKIARQAYREGLETGVMPDIIEHMGCNIPVKTTIGEKAYETISLMVTTCRK